MEAYFSAVADLISQNVPQRSGKPTGNVKFESYLTKIRKSISTQKQRNSAKQPERKTKLYSENNRRTIFVRNLPSTVNMEELKNLFSKYGNIEDVSLRCTPLANTREPKKVAAMKKNLYCKQTNISAYIRFTKKEFSEKALEANGLLFDGDHHIRVDRAIREDTAKYDSKKGVILYNVHFEAEEEELRSIFEVCGEINNVRIIRDHNTGVGKGFAYINFKSEDAVELALQMDGYLLKNRGLSINRIHENKNKQKTPNKAVKSNRFLTDGSV